MARSIEAEVRQWAPKTLTATAMLVLYSLADSANHDDRMVWLSNATLVHDTRSSERGVQNAIKQLDALNIVTRVPDDAIPKRAHGYTTVVRIIQPVSQWAQIYDRVTGQDTPQGAECTPPQDLHPRNICTEQGADPAPKPNTHNPTPKQKETPSLSAYPGRARGPRTAISEKSLTRRSKRKPRIDDDSGFDASKIVDGDDPVTPPATRGVDPDSALGLVRYFRDAMQRRPAAREVMRVPDAIHWGAMVEALSRWLAGGTSSSQIRAMIDAYAAQTEFQATQIAPWRDFLAARVRLFNSAARHGHQIAAANPGSPEALAYYGLTPGQVTPYDPDDPDTLSARRARAVAKAKARRAEERRQQAA